MASISDITTGDLLKGSSTLTDYVSRSTNSNFILEDDRYRNMVDTMKVGVAGLTYVGTKNYLASGAMASLVDVSANIVESGYRLGDYIINKKIKGKGVHTFDYKQHKRNVVNAVNSDKHGINSVATFSLGRTSGGKTESLSDIPVQLNGGYQSGVAMVIDKGDPFYYDGYNPLESNPRYLKFKVADQNEFLAANAHLSSDPNVRYASYDDKKLTKDQIKELDEVQDIMYGSQQRSFIKNLKDNVDDPDVHLDVTGAPYYFDDKEGKFYPSTVRYSGDSLKELISIAENTNRSKNVTKGYSRHDEANIDMADITFAHGMHAEHVSTRSSNLTHPEYVDPEVFEEVFTEKRYRHQAIHFIKAGVVGMKTIYQKLKEKGSKLFKRNKDKIRKNIEDVENDAVELLGVEPSEMQVVQEVEDVKENTVVQSEEYRQLRNIMSKNFGKNSHIPNKSGPDTSSPSMPS